MVSLLSMVNSFVNSGSITYLENGFTAISVFNNVSSFMMIALIRYYLLVHTKTNKNEEEIDMMKVKNISLKINCLVFIIILLIRGGLVLSKLVGNDVKLGLGASGICLTILPLVSALIVSE